MMSRLRSIEEIPEPYKRIFRDYQTFNRIQSIVFDDLLHKNSSVVVTAPTGSGKTALFELALVKLLLDEGANRSLKAVYIAPVEALCNKRYEDWKSKFSAIGISCIKLVEDSSDDQNPSTRQIILSTPEKFDAITRRWKDSDSIVPNVKLLMLDDMDLYQDKRLGPVMESFVSRMKTMMQITWSEGSARFIGVSSTIYNIADLATWLGSTENPAVSYRFVNKFVRGYPQSGDQDVFSYDSTLSNEIRPLIQAYSNEKPVLIFCSTRHVVEQTSEDLSKRLLFNFRPDHKEKMMIFSNQIIDLKLRKLLPLGIGYHHASLAATDRCLVQHLFKQGFLPVLVATSTLALGENLSAHLVIVKSTHQFVSGRIDKYEDSTVLQMVGQIGGSQFDTPAIAIILTKPEMVNHYEQLLKCKEVLESSLHLNFLELLNAEIVLQTFSGLSCVTEWIKNTFLYHRAVKNPQYYNVGSRGSLYDIESDLYLLALREITDLRTAGLVEKYISSTAYGQLMSHYYVCFTTFKLFSYVQPTATISDLLCLLCDSREMAELFLRDSIQWTLNELNNVRFPINGIISNRSTKVNCLVQAFLGCLTITDPSLSEKVLKAVSVLERLCECLSEVIRPTHWYIAYISAVTLTKCLHARLWENSCYVSRQVKQIGPKLSSILVNHGKKTSFNAFVTSSPQELETILNERPPFGRILLETVNHLPRYYVDVDIHRRERTVLLLISISIENLDRVSQVNTAGPNHTVTIIVGDTDNALLYSEKVSDSTLLRTPLFFEVECHFPLPQSVIINVISNQWVGIDVTKSVTLNLFANAFVSCTSHLALETAREVTMIKNPVDNRPKSESFQINYPTGHSTSDVTAASANGIPFAASSRPQPSASGFGGGSEPNSNPVHQTLTSPNEKKADAYSYYPKCSETAQNQLRAVWQNSFQLAHSGFEATSRDNVTFINNSFLPPNFNGTVPAEASLQVTKNVFDAEEYPRNSVTSSEFPCFEVDFLGNIPSGFGATSRDDGTVKNNSHFAPNFSGTYPAEAPFKVAGNVFDAAEYSTNPVTSTVTSNQAHVNPYFNGNKTDTVEDPIQKYNTFYDALETFRKSSFTNNTSSEGNARMHNGEVTSRDSPDKIENGTNPFQFLSINQFGDLSITSNSTVHHRNGSSEVTSSKRPEENPRNPIEVAIQRSTQVQATSSSFELETTSHDFDAIDTVRRDQIVVQNGYSNPCTTEPIRLSTVEENVADKTEIVQYGKRFPKPTDVSLSEDDDEFAKNEVSSSNFNKNNELCTAEQETAEIKEEGLAKKRAPFNFDSFLAAARRSKPGA